MGSSNGNGSKEDRAWQAFVFLFLCLCLAVLILAVRGLYRETHAVYTLECSGRIIAVGNEAWTLRHGVWEPNRSNFSYTPLPGEICRLTREVK